MKPATLLLTLLFATALHAADPYVSLSIYKSGDNRKDLSAIEDEIRSAKPDAYAAIEQKLLAALPSATPDAKQFICRQLTIVASDASVPALAKLLPDPDLSHAARLALEPMRSEAAAKALRDALESNRVKLLLSIIPSVGARRDQAALPKLIELAKSEDPQVAPVATAAIGKLGSLQALRALNRIETPAAVHARLECANLLVREGKMREAALEIGGRIRHLNSGDEEIAVMRALILGGILPEDWLKALGNDASENVRLAAAAACREPAQRALRLRLVSDFDKIDPAGQLLALGVLLDLNDVPLHDLLINLAQKGKDDAVRATAIDGLANHATAADVPLLIKLATDVPTAAAARRTLQRVGADGVDRAVVAAAKAGEAPARRVAIQALAARRVTSALGVLEGLVSDEAVGVDAVNALGEIGGVDQLDYLMTQSNPDDDALRSAVEKAATAIAARATDKKAARDVVIKYLENPSHVIPTLAVLSKLGGDDALKAIRPFLSEQAAPKFKDAAIRSLANWPDLAAAPELLKIARESQNTTHAVLALRGFLRLAAAAKDKPLADRVTMFKDGLAAAKRPDEKREALAGLAELPSLESLDLIRKSLADAALTNEAFAASIKLTKKLALAYPTQSLATLDELKIYAKSDDHKKQIDEAVTAVKKAGLTNGYILSWLYAGPYAKDNKSATDLMSIPFPPEQNEPADWKPFLFTDDNPKKLDFDKAIGGQNRCVYLKTTLTSARAQDAQLEFGSDDGLQVWLNGKVVHTNNATRGLAEGQDKVKIHLNEGPNTLLVKLTQGGGGWEIVARLRTPDGKDIKERHDRGTVAAPNTRA